MEVTVGVVYNVKESINMEIYIEFQPIIFWTYYDLILVINTNRDKLPFALSTKWFQGHPKNDNYFYSLYQCSQFNIMMEKRMMHQRYKEHNKTTDCTFMLEEEAQAVLEGWIKIACTK